MDRSYALIAVLLVACAEDVGPSPVEEMAQRAERVVSAPGDTGEGFHDVQRAVNGVRGGGATKGSLDVYSLSLEAGDELVLSFAQPVPDGEGADLVVFENPFAVAGTTGRFMDPTVVEVSADGELWLAFPHRYGLTGYSDDPADWVGFAGIEPVLLHEEEAPGDPLAAEAGGDAFDLADLSAAMEEIAMAEVQFVRLTAAAAWLDPETGEAFPTATVSNGPDIDGVYGRLP